MTAGAIATCDGHDTGGWRLSAILSDGQGYYRRAGILTVVSLLVVPALYVYFDSLAAWGRKVMRTADLARESSQNSAAV